MATIINLSLSLLFLSILHLTSAISPPSSNFVRTSCRSTTYPAVCINSLMRYAPDIKKSSHNLVMTALTVSVAHAESTRSFVGKLRKFKDLKPKERAAINDCYEEIKESVEQLSKSVKELKGMGKNRGPEYLWHLSNLQTWVSAALTDDTTCSDGFSGNDMNGRIKNSIRTRMTNVAQVTSNALALCNKFGGK